MDAMKQMHQDDETKRKTMEMLKRIHLEEEMDGEEGGGDVEGGSSVLIEL